MTFEQAIEKVRAAVGETCTHVSIERVEGVTQYFDGVPERSNRLRYSVCWGSCAVDGSKIGGGEELDGAVDAAIAIAAKLRLVLRTIADDDARLDVALDRAIAEAERT